MAFPYMEAVVGLSPPPRPPNLNTFLLLFLSTLRLFSSKFSIILRLPSIRVLHALHSYSFLHFILICLLYICVTPIPIKGFIADVWDFCFYDNRGLFMEKSLRFISETE